MQKKGANISLKGYDDIFSTDQSRAEAQQERVQEIPLSELHPFEGHPFRVVDDEEMMKTAESVRDFGVLTPAIVRPDPDGGYEIVSGHRRHRASELAGKETMPAIVRDLDDDAAIILMVDANLQRESILPSERAFAYKMKLDAIKHQGQRTDLTSSQVGMKLQAMDIVGQEAGESRNQVHRYSLRHSSITYKLKLNGGDMKSVQGDSGHAQVKMVADVYSHIIDDDRRLNAERMEAAFYSGRQATPEPVQPAATESSADDKELLLKLLQNPEMAALLKSLAKTL